MTSFNKLNHGSRNGEVNATVTLINNRLAENDWTADVYLAALIIQLISTNANMVEALNRLRVYSKLEEADLKRDEWVKSLFSLVTGYTYIPIEAVKDAADVVFNILNQYGISIIHESHNEESADIDSLLNDLGKADIAAACAQMQGVPEVIASLTQAEADFEALALEQVETEVAKEDISSASSIKTDLLVLVNSTLLPYLETMSKVNPTEYLSTAEAVAKLIDQNNEVVKRRSSKSTSDI